MKIKECIINNNKMEVLISKLCYIDKEFDKYKESSEELGYIFLVKNSIYSVYNENILILDYGINKKSIEEKYKKNYINKIEIILSIKNEHVEMIYKILLIILNEYRIVRNKNFFVNEKELKKELEMVKLNFKKKDGLESYINYIITLINKSHGNIQNFKNKLKMKDIKEIKCVNSIKNLNIIKINKSKGILELIKNYSSPIRKYGFMVLVKSDLIEKYYRGEISYLLVSNKYKELIESIFISEYNISSFRVYDYELCELMVKDKLCDVNISNGYYMCRGEKINEVYEKIKNYFENYNEIEKIKKAYLYNEYNIGKKIEKEQEEKRYNIKKSINTRHKKILENRKELEKEFNEEEFYKNMLGEKEEIKEPIIRRSRYELVCDRLDKKEN